MIVTVLATAAGTLAASHYGPWVWNWLNTKEPRLTSRILDLEAEAEDEFARAYHAFKPTIKAAETEGETIVTEVEQTIVAKLQAVFSSKDQSIANLQSQVADLQKQLSDAEAAHADFVNTVNTLAGS